MAVAWSQAPIRSLRNCKHQTSHLKALHVGTRGPSTQAEMKSTRELQADQCTAKKIFLLQY